MSNRKTILLIGAFLLAAGLSLLARLLDDTKKTRIPESGLVPTQTDKSLRAKIASAARCPPTTIPPRIPIPSKSTVPSCSSSDGS